MRCSCHQVIERPRSLAFSLKPSANLRESKNLNSQTPNRVIKSSLGRDSTGRLDPDRWGLSREHRAQRSQRVILGERELRGASNSEVPQLLRMVRSISIAWIGLMLSEGALKIYMFRVFGLRMLGRAGCGQPR